MQRHAGEGEFGRRGGGWLMGNMLRRCKSSWLCMKFELASLADHGILIRVLPPSRLALTVSKLWLLFWPNPYATSCFVLHLFRMRFSCFFWAVVGFPYEISYFTSLKSEIS